MEKLRFKSVVCLPMVAVQTLHRSMQLVKDLSAIFVFWWLACRPEFYERRLLSVLFTVGWLIDTLYVCTTWCLHIPWTWASFKDFLGAYGMFGFSVILVVAPENNCPSNWYYFFVFAAGVDTLSLLSVCTRFNIYMLNI